MLSTNNYYSNTITCGPTATPCDGSVGGNVFANGATSLATFLTPLEEPLAAGLWDFASGTVWEDRSTMDLFPKLVCPAAASADFCTKWDAAQN